MDNEYADDEVTINKINKSFNKIFSQKQTIVQSSEKQIINYV